MEIVMFQGRAYINTTPHPITLQGEDEVLASIPPCGTLLNASPREREAGRTACGCTLVETIFLPSMEGEDFLQTVPPGTLVLGSVIAAQAYPGRVMGLVPVPGYERVSPAEKRMRADKFTIYREQDPPVVI